MKVVPQVEMELLCAADAFRNTMIPRADCWHGAAPLWYGWAVFGAFLAGAKWAKQQREGGPNPPLTDMRSDDDNN